MSRFCWLFLIIALAVPSVQAQSQEPPPSMYVAVMAFEVTGYTVGGVSTGVILEGAFKGGYDPLLVAPSNFLIEFWKDVDFVSSVWGYLGTSSTRVIWVPKNDNPLVAYRLEWGDNPLAGCQTYRNAFYPAADSCVVTYRARIEAWTLPEIWPYIEYIPPVRLAYDEMRANYSVTVSFGGGGGGSIPP